jgi:dTDP-4-amino-4,6-dideoxygalactose transaminase
VRPGVPFVDLIAEHRSVAAEVGPAVAGVLADCRFILGPQVEEFERAFAALSGVAHAVGVSSGLDALRLSLLALDIGPGDEVILPANTYIATALAVTAVGARPVLVDCDPHTYLLDPMGVEAAITTRTRAVIPVHLTGQAADMDRLLEMAARHGFQVVEDAAQAHGAVYKGRPCGSVGTMGCFSFYPSKNLGAYGDGGMVTTDDAELARRLRRLRNYGQEAKYYHIDKGLNARLDTIQAAILLVKLAHLPAWNETRAGHAALYQELLSGVDGLTFQQRAPWSTHVHHLLVVECDDRDALRDHLAAAGVQTGIHYPVPIHLQPAYADLGHRQGEFPNAEHLAGRILSLPIYPQLTPGQVAYVAGTVRTFVGRLDEQKPCTPFASLAVRSNEEV